MAYYYNFNTLQKLDAVAVTKFKNNNKIRGLYAGIKILTKKINNKLDKYLDLTSK